MNKYEWLVKHLAWNASKPTGNTFWVKVSEQDAESLAEQYELVTTRLLIGGVTVKVVKILDNNVVLDTR